MNVKYCNVLLKTLTLLLWATPLLAWGQEMVINSATPSSGEQGVVALEVTIGGENFDNTIESVEFLLPSGAAGGITTRSFKVRGQSKIRATIDIAPDAVADQYDIAVTTRGRGGKGTTYRGEALFEVKVRPNQSLVSCDMFAPNGTCNCRFIVDDDSTIHKPVENCKTSETLWLGSSHIFGFETSPGWTELKAVNCDSSDPAVSDCLDENGVSFEGQFLGSSVISNTNHNAKIRQLNIRFDDTVSRGCGPNDDVRAGVSFVLHEGIDTPPVGNSFLQIWETRIDSHDDPLCVGVEIVRESGYTDRWPDGKDWKVTVEEVEITDGSYVMAGIRYEGIRPQHSLNPPAVWRNTVGSPACLGDDPQLDPVEARAIQFGKVLLSDPDDPTSQISGVVQENTIRMATPCAGLGGVAIDIRGEAGNPMGVQTTAEVIKNDVAGALIGILVDDHVVDVNFTGNSLAGDNVIGSIGICSDAQSSQFKGKPNKISDYDYDVITAAPDTPDFDCVSMP